MKFKKLGATFMAAAVLAMSMAGSAFAAENPTRDVVGSYSGEGGAPVYSYTYSWGAQDGNFAFEYSGASSGTWDPNTHTMGGAASQGGWRAVNDNDIKIVNHSNAPIKVVLTFDATKSGMAFGFTDNGFTIPSAVGTTVDNAPSKTVQVGPTADCPGLSAGETNVKLGTVTLKVTGA